MNDLSRAVDQNARVAAERDAAVQRRLDFYRALDASRETRREFTRLILDISNVRGNQFTNSGHTAWNLGRESVGKLYLQLLEATPKGRALWAQMLYERDEEANVR